MDANNGQDINPRQLGPELLQHPEQLELITVEVADGPPGMVQWSALLSGRIRAGASGTTPGNDLWGLVQASLEAGFRAPNGPVLDSILGHLGESTGRFVWQSGDFSCHCNSPECRGTSGSKEK